MAKDPTKTVRIQRDSRVAEDPRGRNVWVGRVEEAAELELVSTTSLEKVLSGGDGAAKGEIRKLAESGKEGLLARDAATGRYQIADPVSEDTMSRASELSLVSTMMLRKVIGADGKADFVDAAAEKPKPEETSGRDKFGGFDPYNKS